MGRKRKTIRIENGEIKTSEIPENSANENSEIPPAESSPAHPEIFENNRRVSFTVDSDGHIDFDKLQDKTKIQLKEIFSRPSELRKLGLSPKVSQEISEMGFGEDEANAILGFITTIDAPIAARMYNVPKEIAIKAFTFDDYQRSKLNPPMIRLMNKWGPSVLKTWKDEVGFALIMFSTLSAQVLAMNMLEEQRKAKLPANASPNVTPINRETLRQSAPVPQAPPPPPQNDGKIRTEPFVAQDENDVFLENSGLAI